MLGSRFPASGIFLSGDLCFYRYLQSLPCRFLGAVQPLGLLWDPGAEQAGCSGLLKERTRLLQGPLP